LPQALIATSILAGTAETLYGTLGTPSSIGQIALILWKLMDPAAGLVFSLRLGAAALSLSYRKHRHRHRQL
jgi:hypothetical protein